MSEEDFTKLYRYFDKRFSEVEKQFEKVHDDNNKTLNAVDAYAKQAETYMQEMLALAHKVDPLEQWIMKVAEATGVKLTA
jgi:uncharacterized coiled-coil DUF342 family protein